MDRKRTMAAFDRSRTPSDSPPTASMSAPGRSGSLGCRLRLGRCTPGLYPLRSELQASHECHKTFACRFRGRGEALELQEPEPADQRHHHLVVVDAHVVDARDG